MTIKELRQRAGMTQQQLAEKAGMDEPQLSRIENGKRSPGVKVLQRIADALNAPIELIANANTETKEAPRCKKIFCLDTGIDLFVD